MESLVGARSCGALLAVVNSLDLFHENWEGTEGSCTEKWHDLCF